MTDVHETNIVVVAILHRDGKVFIAKRAASKKTFPDRFELIGGHVDSGEPVLDPNDHSTSRWIDEDELHLFEKDDEETEALRRAFKYLKGL